MVIKTAEVSGGRKIMITLYNVISSDGFIAEDDGSEHFIPDSLWPTTLEMYKKYDALVMGRKTYEAIQDYPKELLEPFEKLAIKKVIVTTNRQFYANPTFGYVIANSPQDALAAGSNVLVSSGPTLNSFLLENKLVNKVVYHQVPATIGKGVRPFNFDTKKLLIRTSEEKLADGVKELTFQVLH
jgi:dihydrofolate reductase